MECGVDGEFSLENQTALANFWTDLFAFCTLRAVLPRFFSVILVPALMLSACAAPVSSRLQGRWEGVSVENVDLAQLATVTGWVRGLRFEFGGSRITIDVPTELPRTGSYRVIREHERQLMLEIAGPNGKLDRAEFVVESDERLRWQIGEGRSVILQRSH
jgi:hypothetical protein